MNPDNIPESPLASQTAALRARLYAVRRAQPASVRERDALRLRARLYTWLALRRDAALANQQAVPQTIAAYHPLPDEPDLYPLLTQWVAAGLTVALPVVVRRCVPLAFRTWTPDTVMAAGAYGILEPQDTPDVMPDVVLVPTLGYNDRAYRLGYGGGYYDRTLARWRDQAHPYTAIGIAWACGRLCDDDWQPAAHDMPLAAVLTPQDWIPAAPV